MARLGQDSPEHNRRGQGEAADHRQRHAPAEKIGKDPGEQAAAHAADGVAADIESHREGHKAGVDLLAQVGHTDRRHAAQRQANQGAHNQDAVPAGHHGRQQRAAGGQQQRGDHHRLAAYGVRQRAGKQQAHRQHRRGNGERNTAAGRRYAELVRQHRQDRLHAVEQGEGGQTGGEQRERDAHKLRGAALNKRIRTGCTSDADLARRHGVNGCCTTHREFLG